MNGGFTWRMPCSLLNCQVDSLGEKWRGQKTPQMVACPPNIDVKYLTNILSLTKRFVNKLAHCARSTGSAINFMLLTYSYLLTYLQLTCNCAEILLLLKTCSTKIASTTSLHPPPLPHFQETARRPFNPIFCHWMPSAALSMQRR